MPLLRTLRELAGKPAVRWLAGSFALAWGLSLIWWGVLEPVEARKDIPELVIAPGTAAAVERGEPAPFIPNSLELGRDKSLRIVNNDVVAHKVGAWSVPPGGTALIEPTVSSDGTVTCSFSTGGALSAKIDQRPPITETFLPTIILGVPLGLVSFVVVSITSKIGAAHEADETHLNA